MHLHLELLLKVAVLFHLVYQHLVVDVELDVSHVVTRDNLGDLAYVLTSCDVLQVSHLKRVH